MKIKIVGLTFDVVEVECIEHGSAEIGRIDHLNQKIYIKKGLSKERKKVVLLHEAIHCILEQFGFESEHDDEKLICTLSTVICQWIDDNKLFSL